MTRIEIITEYQVNERGVIKSPGKFEGEYLYAPYFYDLMLGGCGDSVYEDSDESADLAGHYLYTEMDIEQTDRDYFPEISADTKTVRVYESNDGFISLEEV